MKIQDENRANKKTIMPFLGVTQFDKNGIIEVEDDKIAEAIIESVPGFHKLGEKAAKTKEAEKKKTEAEEKKEEAIANIKGMKLEELKELAEQSELPKEDWENLKVTALKKYLIGKIS
jgi:ribosomal protein L11 methylase PrmA